MIWIISYNLYQQPFKMLKKMYAKERINMKENPIYNSIYE